MPSRFTLPHLDISARVATQDYAGDGSRNTGAVRIREEHGRRVQNELRVALEAADQSRPVDERLPAPMGAYVEVELRRGTAVDKVELKSEGIRAGAAKATDGNTRTIALYVPDHARPILEQILDEYLNGDLTPQRQKPTKQEPGRIHRSYPHGAHRYALDRSEADSGRPTAANLVGAMVLQGKGNGD
jgi:hypothetical protein